MESRKVSENIQWGWDMSLEGEDKKNFIFKQLYKYLCESGNKMPQIGSDEQGSDLGFDWFLLTEFEARKIIEEIDKDKK